MKYKIVSCTLWHFLVVNYMWERGHFHFHCTTRAHFFGLCFSVFSLDSLFCNISIVTYPLDLTIDNNRHHCYTATQGKHCVNRILYSSVHKRLSLTLPCWKLAFCTASVFCCRLSIQQHWHDSNALYCKKLLHFVFRDSLWVFQISTNYRCT